MAAGSLTWVEDVLPGYVAAPLNGATLVRDLEAPSSPAAAIVHVHGYNDYFFHTHIPAALRDAGIAFAAVDLPGAGRSLGSTPIPHFMTDVDQPGRSIDAAVAAVSSLWPGVPVFVHAHSTGGLSAVMWAARHARGRIAGLVLNAPLFGFVSSAIQRRVLPAVAAATGRLAPTAVLAHRPSAYAAALHVSGGGEWDFDLEWKRPQGVPLRAAWLAAVLRAQRAVARGLDLRLPVLVAHADSSGPDDSANPRLSSQDTVVDVSEVERLARRIGPTVDLQVCAGAVHDVSLSAPEVRGAYLALVRDWIGAHS